MNHRRQQVKDMPTNKRSKWEKLGVEEAALLVVGLYYTVAGLLGIVGHMAAPFGATPQFALGAGVAMLLTANALLAMAVGSNIIENKDDGQIGMPRPPRCDPWCAFHEKGVHESDCRARSKIGGH